MGSFDLDKTYQYLLILLAFLMPLSVAGANLIIVLICLIWIFSGSYSYKFKQIADSKLLVASIVFFFTHLVGLLWTEDLKWGLHIVHKMWYFVGLFPILYTIVKYDYIRLYISAFLIAISFTEIASYLVWFEIIEPFKNASVRNPTPFMSHISYNPILCVAIYFVAHKVLFEKQLGKFTRFTLIFFGISMSINMFITGGRAGQVMYLVMISILILQFFNKKKFKAMMLILFIVPSIFFTAYQTSDLFKHRVNSAYENTIAYSEKRGSSVGLRITYAMHSWEIIKENPILGVGTGDFPTEYKKINEIKTPNLPNSTNPHNMYTLILTQLGIFGLMSMAYFFYCQFKFSLSSKDKFLKDTGLTLPALFLVIMWSDSYLLGHFTSLLYIFLSSFLYKDFEKNK